MYIHTYLGHYAYKLEDIVFFNIYIYVYIFYTKTYSTYSKVYLSYKFTIINL